MGIMAVEWALFLILAWYFDQVLYTGDSSVPTLLALCYTQTLSNALLTA